MDGYLFSSTFCFVEDILPPRVRHGILCSLDDLELKANAISYSSSHLFLFFVLVFLFINMPYIHLSSQTINPTNKRYVLKFQHKRNGGERERERVWHTTHICMHRNDPTQQDFLILSHGRATCAVSGVSLLPLLLPLSLDTHICLVLCMCVEG